MDKITLANLNKDLMLTLNANPGLTIKYKNDIPTHVKGTYQVLDNNNSLQDEFDINVSIPSNYPFGFPVLQEISQKIPRHIDRHMFNEGYACVELTHKAMLVAKAGITIYEYFVKYVHRYFCWQLVYEIDKGNKNLTEWAHGNEAIVEFYKDFLVLSSYTDIRSLLQVAAANKIPSLNKDCPCNSGKLFKRCHLPLYQTLLSLGNRRLTKDVEILDKFTTS